MQFLHESNVVHGSVNNVNVLVDSYGRAKVTGISPPHHAATTSQKVAIFKEDDVYGFGVILWELLTGKSFSNSSRTRQECSKQ